ncbi:MAG: hypothetical protein ACI39R_00810 [Lachnospiraceae bacterium]
MSSYNDDYDRICQLEADIEVLERKQADYTRIERSVQNDFDRMVKKLAELEVEAQELDGFSWKKIKSKVSGKYEVLDINNRRAREAGQREMNSIRFKLSDVRGKLKDIKEELKRNKTEYNRLREYMKRTYTEFNEYEKHIQAENQKLRSIIKEIDEAITVVNEVEGIAGLARDKFKSARSWGVADMVFDDGFFCDVVKYNKVNDAEQMVYVMNAAIERMNKELRDVNNIYSVYCTEFGSGLVFMDMIFDNVFVDWTVLNHIEENINKLDSFILKLQQTEDSLKNNRRQVEKQIKK